MNLGKVFDRVAKAVAWASGRPATFLMAATLIVVWLVTGPFFGFNDTWQLIINTTTTIITFLMVFLIQSTQNRDTTALQLKLDELIRVTEKANNAMLDLEELGEKKLEELREKYEQLARKAREGGAELGTPDVEK